MQIVDLGQCPVVGQIVDRLAGDGSALVRAEGTWGSFAPLLTAYLFDKLRRPILYVRPHIDDTDKATDDLLTFGVGALEPLAGWEGQEDLADATDEVRVARLRLSILLTTLTTDPKPLVVTAPIQALCQPIPKPGLLRQSGLTLVVNQDTPHEQVVQWLVNSGFEGVDRIDLPGQFARRGGIIDVFAPVTGELVLSRTQGGATGQPGSQQGAAMRVEFFGDRIESLRLIDLDTQRSTAAIERVTLMSATAGTQDSEGALFLEVLPSRTLIVLEEPTECEEVANVFLERSPQPDRLFAWDRIYKAMAGFQQLHLSRFGATPGESISLGVKSVQQYQHALTSAWEGHKAALEQLAQQAADGRHVVLYCESSAEITRVGEIIEQISKRPPHGLRLVKGYIHQGFAVDSMDTIVISHHELFGQYALRRTQRPMRRSVAVDSLEDLQEGDYVVHASYGIGKFLGIETIEEKGGRTEYLTIEYADEVKVHVSVSNITLIQKYIGTSPRRPRLSKVGSKKWHKQKEKVAESVRDLAAELLDLQARRQLAGGFAFGPDSHFQREFEQSFPYQETQDQVTAADQIKADMEHPVVMDRLLCGDVGYGKTELAIRAAFKAIENGKQVAVLVPTTVLCVQHGRTFTDRFADFPISVEVLNRFRTGREAAEVLRRTRDGRVDVVIGTHRLLSGDVQFKDLGLLIIDEEQRFGVEHKERLKRLRVNVDILTMTATPIPRTLHMAMLGLRDISSLATAPLDRRAVVTTVAHYNPQTIRQAALRELNRGGQVFFLHNRVKTIDKKAWEIRNLMADTQARIMIAHGQMGKGELEDAMVEFVEGRTQILVCTTIIESGLDIPNANTIFIDDADRFGLAELHQLRGRVGRYRHKAYAYLLLPASRPVTPIASKRLKAIEEYSHLGAGFRIALRDLEIRGAGNILGAEQSGHIQLVGYQMYCQMLAEEVRRLKNEPIQQLPKVTLDLGFTTSIPKAYIASDRLRMDVYRRIASCCDSKTMQELSAELTDVYGPIPEDVALLLRMAEIRLLAGPYDIQRIAVSGRNLIFAFGDKPSDRASSLFARVSGTVRVPDPRTIVLQLEPNYFEPATLVRVLRKFFSGR